MGLHDHTMEVDERFAHTQELGSPARMPEELIRSSTHEATARPTSAVADHCIPPSGNACANCVPLVHAHDAFPCSSPTHAVMMEVRASAALIRELQQQVAELRALVESLDTLEPA